MDRTAIRQEDEIIEAVANLADAYHERRAHERTLWDEIRTLEIQLVTKKFQLRQAQEARIEAKQALVQGMEQEWKKES